MRAPYLDALRGVAVVWMIIFHFCYDMAMLNLVDWNFAEGFWWYFPRLIAGTFLFCVGISLFYAHTPQVKWHALLKRSLRLGGAALIISLVTYLVFPQQWIFFGTLHCILAGSILGALLVNHRSLSLITMMACLVGQYILNYDIKWVSSVVQKPSMDFIPIYPWLWVILAGSLLAPYLSRIPWLMQMRSPKILDLLGKHSLKIYLLHQPLIYGLLLGIKAAFFR